MADNNVRKAHYSTKQLTIMALFAAIIILMAFTPIGYLKIGVIEITFITIPVIVGAITLGSDAGAVLGAVFGLTSFIQCFGMSAFGSALLSINPVFAFIMCVPTRILVGWATGIIYRTLRRRKVEQTVSYGLSCLSGALINTVAFTSVFIGLFWNTDYVRSLCEMLGSSNVFAFAAGFVGVNGLVEAVVCAVIGTAIVKALREVIRRS